MKVVVISLAFIVLLLSNASYVQATPTFTLHDARLVEKRYYLIKRLQEPIKIFNFAQDHYGKKGPSFVGKLVDLDPQLIALFHHEIIKQAIAGMMHHKSLNPFYKVWDDFLSYQLLDDQNFSQEIITLLLLLYKNFLHEIDKDPGIKKDSLLPSRTWKSSSAKDLASHYYPELTNILIECHHAPSDLCRDSDCESWHNIMHALKHLLTDSENTLNGDIVLYNSMRFYYIQRLMRSMFLLAKHRHCIVIEHCQVSSLIDDIRIKECAEQIDSTQTLTPLFKMWKNIITYHHIDDTIFLRDYIRLIIIVYKNISEQLVQDQLYPAQEKTNYQNSLEFYQIIASLPISELLSLLDDLSERFCELSQKYELTNSALTWSVWFNKYWWSPLAIMGSLLATTARYTRVLALTIQSFIKLSSV